MRAATGESLQASQKSFRAATPPKYMTPSERRLQSADGGKYVLIVGQEPTQSAPTLTLSKALTGMGVPVRFVTIDDVRRLDWLRIVRSARAVVLVSYLVFDAYRLSQLATAVACNVPIVRWWVGTDVLNVITRENVRESAALLDRIVSANVCVASHLVDELATAGIHAQFIPSVLDPDLVPPGVAPWFDGTKPILVYMPGGRKEFYGLSAMEPVIAANPDLHFIVMADETHSLASYQNVESLGWVSDMSHIYARAGCVLRITDHDGLPRMLMEGLLRGLYAIYSWPFVGCWKARTREEIDAALSRYRAVTQPNMVGRDAMLEMLSAQPDRQMESAITGAFVSLAVRGRALALAIRIIFFNRRLDGVSG